MVGSVEILLEVTWAIVSETDTEILLSSGSKIGGGSSVVSEGGISSCCELFGCWILVFIVWSGVGPIVIFS